MPNKLATALRTRINEQGLEGRTAEAAKAIGVSYPSLAGVLAGRAKPNKSTGARYQAFLGIGDEDFANLLGDVQVARKPRGDGAAPRKPGRPAGRPAGAGKAAAGGNGDELARAARALGDLLQDGLALSVHRASPEIRSVIERILG
jgi:hypothetical protein